MHQTTHAYSKRVPYYVAFNPSGEVITHDLDAEDCAQKAQEITGQASSIYPATWMTNDQFAQAVDQIKPSDLDFFGDVDVMFCGKLIFQCAGMFFDQYGEQYPACKGTPLMFKPIQ